MPKMRFTMGYFMRVILWVILLGLGQTAFATDMTASERDAFRAEVRAYLLENPEVLVEAMTELQSRKDAADTAKDQALLTTYKTELFSDPNSYVGGNPDGDITIVEFTDYRCAYCRKAFAEIEDLIKTDGNIRFVVKEYPILGDASVISTRFAVAVLQLHGPAAYKAAHDGLITLRGEPDATTLTELAEKLGLKATDILARMNAPSVDAVIAANADLGQKMGINGTPTFVVNGQLLRGYVPLEQMKEIVAAERAS